MGGRPRVACVWFLTCFAMASVAAGQLRRQQGEDPDPGTWVVDCNGQGDHFSIQEAIDQAQGGDTIIVMPSVGCADGAYVENIFFNGKAITVRSADPADPDIVAGTIIDGSGADRTGAGGSVVTFRDSEGRGSVLDGLTVTGGIGTRPHATATWRIGGGILLRPASPTIRRCVVVHNDADFGGGIAMAGPGSPLLQDVVIASNAAEGVTVSSASNPELRGCRILDHPEVGMRAVDGTTVRLQRCIVRGNGDGGLRLYGNSELESCLIAGNTGDSGAGLSLHRAAIVANCTVVENLATTVGGGLDYVGQGPLTVRNTILWANTAPQGPQLSVRGSHSPIDATIQYSSIQGALVDTHLDAQDLSLTWGPGIQDSDPRFSKNRVAPYTLTRNSPCIDAGDPATAVYRQRLDAYGDLRLANCRVDIGADEFRAGAPDLMCIEWSLSTIGPVDGPWTAPHPDERYTIAFEENGTIIGIEDCNDCGATYERNGSEIVVSGASCQQIGCQSQSQLPCGNFFTNVGFGHTLYHDDNRLRLHFTCHLDGGHYVLNFVPARLRSSR